MVLMHNVESIYIQNTNLDTYTIYGIGLGVRFNATFNNISVTSISWRSVLLANTWMGFELTTLVVISTDCIGSCKSNYHTIPTTTAPTIYVHVYCHKVFSLCCTSFRYGLKNQPLFVAYVVITIRSFLQSWRFIRFV
jgi:hypothetical protein